MWYEIIDRGGEIFMVVLPRNSNHLVLYNTKLLSSASVYEMAIVLTKQEIEIAEIEKLIL